MHTKLLPSDHGELELTSMSYCLDHLEKTRTMRPVSTGYFIQVKVNTDQHPSYSVRLPRDTQDRKRYHTQSHWHQHWLCIRFFDEAAYAK